MKLLLIFISVLFLFFGYLFLSDAKEHVKWEDFDTCIAKKGGLTTTDHAFDDDGQLILLEEGYLVSDAKKMFAEGDYEKIMDCAEQTGATD